MGEAKNTATQLVNGVSTIVGTDGKLPDCKGTNGAIEYNGIMMYVRNCYKKVAHDIHDWNSYALDPVKDDTAPHKPTKRAGSGIACVCDGTGLTPDVNSTYTGKGYSTYSYKKNNYVDGKYLKADGTPWREDFTKPITVREARAIAYDMHKGDKDKSGDPYKLHLHAVAQGVVVLGGSDEEVIAAYFHDAEEDFHTTFEHLEEIGCTENTVNIVKAVSKHTGEEQSVYLDRIIAAGAGAMRVKVADLLHNTRHDRMEKVAKVKGEYTRTRLLKKYRPAIARLMLELGIIADEDEQKKLATKPVGTAGGTVSYYGGSGSKGTTGTSGTTGSLTAQTYEVASLLAGDWPKGWPAPIAEVEKDISVHDKERTFVLANGEVRTEDRYAKGSSTKRRISVFTWNQWTASTAVVPTENVPEDDITEFITILEALRGNKAAEKVTPKAAITTGKSTGNPLTDDWTPPEKSEGDKAQITAEQVDAWIDSM